VALAAIALHRWHLRRDRASAWIALAFIAIALIVTVGRLVPSHPHNVAELAGQRFDVELLVLFPFLLYRFATEFVPPGRRLRIVVGAFTVGLTIWTFALPHVPASGEHWQPSFVAYIAVFLLHWIVLSIAVTTRLWRAGRGQPSVAANRMRMLSFASAALAVALLASVFAGGRSSPAAAVAQMLAFVAIVAFYLGIEPPQLVRAYWRQPEQERLQSALRGLVTLAMSRTEIAERVAGPAAGLVGARGLTVYDDEGRELATYGTPGGEGGVRIDEPGLSVVAWTSAYAPYFGEDEHETRLALERANELMTNFVALAAHELRTPVTTIHGFVQTLNHLGSRLSQEQAHELREALEQQTKRMASLVEQLLDLSRLDAEAVSVHPQALDVRQRLAEVVTVAAGARADEVRIDIPDPSHAVVDPEILDHIVSNLVTNALRYGRSPVRVSAVSAEGRLRVAVEDSGPGVAPEIEETLFERFTRAGVARDRVAGTGLGLAIARAYARAHRGDLRYERADPSGARFVVELPSV
jgi:signal transduction histidine kinase